MKLPGAHADVGVGYRFGANVFSDYLAHRIAQEMGLIAHVSKAYSQQPLYGLVDSRGWRDKLAGTPSGYACGFERQAQKVIEFSLSAEQLTAYRNRLATRGALHLDQISSDHSLNFNQPFVIRASSTQTEWDVVPVNIRGLSNYETRVKLSRNENGTPMLAFLDGNNKDQEIMLPDEVFNEIRYYKGKTVQLEITGLNDPASGKPVPRIWFFVNGCLPTDGRLH